MRKFILIILILTLLLSLGFVLPVSAANGNIIFEWNPDAPLAGWRHINAHGNINNAVAVHPSPNPIINGVSTSVIRTHTAQGLVQGLAIIPGTANTEDFILDANIIMEPHDAPNIHGGFVFRLADIASGPSSGVSNQGGHHAYYNTGYTLLFHSVLPEGDGSSRVELLKTPGANVVATADLPIVRGTPLNVRVIADENNINVFVNNMFIPIITYVDSDPGPRLSGEIGIFTIWSPVSFFDVNITGISDDNGGNNGNGPRPQFVPFFDDFRTNTLGTNWVERPHDHLAAAIHTDEQQLRISGLTFLDAAYDGNRLEYADFVLETDFRIGDPTNTYNAGLIIRGALGEGDVARGNAYGIGFNPNTGHVHIFQSAYHGSIMSAYAGITRHEWHSVKVVAHNRRIEVFIDDFITPVLVYNSTNEQRLSGRVGVYTIYAGAWFSNFRISDLEPNVIIGISGGNAIPSVLTAAITLVGDAERPTITNHQWYRVNDPSVRLTEQVRYLTGGN